VPPTCTFVLEFTRIFGSIPNLFHVGTEIGQQARDGMEGAGFLGTLEVAVVSFAPLVVVSNDPGEKYR